LKPNGKNIKVDEKNKEEFLTEMYLFVYQRIKIYSVKIAAKGLR